MTALARLFVLPALALTLGLGVPAAPLWADAAGIATSLTAASVPEKKQTKSALYITAAEAAEVLSTRDDVLLLDVRTPEETVLVGYPTEADANIPVKMFDPAHKLNTKKGSYTMQGNPGFVPATKALIDTQNPAAVLVMCRSGSRSAEAVNMLIEAGVDVPLFSVIDGFEGDKNDKGERVVNGWKNAGAAWTDKAREGLLQGVE
jgi:rhodanese-related sulfurtransferase